MVNTPLSPENGMRLAVLAAMKPAGEKICALTAYDYLMARLLDESGVDIVLVGDSLGMVVLGFPDTTSVTMEHMLHHCAAARRGVRRALLVADLPAHTYENSAAAVANARRLADAGADAVKLEGARLEEIRAITGAGIPLMAHLGMLPQHVAEEGGVYRVKGKTPVEAGVLCEQALAVEAAGAFSVVLELVQPELAAQISSSLRIPTIGIGSGTGCDGQVLVTHDLVGYSPWFKPRFVQPEGDVAGQIRTAVEAFRRKTKG